MSLWVPESARRPVCPAAIPVDLPDGHRGAACGVLAQDRERETQGHNRGRLDAVVFTTRDDPKTYFGFCCADYTSCMIWDAEMRRLQEKRPTLDDADPEPETPAPVLHEVK